jgi:recombination protein RecT
MFAALKAVSLDLPLDQNLGFAYVIPYEVSVLVDKKDEKGNSIMDANRQPVKIWGKQKKAQFQLGYKGFVQLSLRSNQFDTLNVREVKEGEVTGEDFISGELTFTPLPADRREAANTVGYIAFFRLKNGFSKMLYMCNEKIEAHAKRFSQTYKSRNDSIREKSLWSTDFDNMAKKTVLKLLLSKYAPLSVDMIDAIKSDQSVLNGSEPEDIAYVDNTESVTPEERKDALREKMDGQGTQAPEMP